MHDVKLSCGCGEVQGRIKNVTPKSGNRLICYCTDCQKFGRHFNNGQGVLDQFGGTEVVQLAPASIEIKKGIEHVACMRLTPKGMNRWYTSCCDTPIGNVPKATIPFVAMISSFIAPNQDIEQEFGPVLGTISSEQAVDSDGNNPHLPKSSKMAMLKVASQILVWKIGGKGQPNLFFDSEGKTISKPTILDPTPK